MKSLLSAVGCTLTMGIAATAAHAQSTSDHTIIQPPDDVRQSAGPPVQKGAEIADLYRDTSSSATAKDQPETATGLDLKGPPTKLPANKTPE
jgi:hypothetical protein